MGDTTIFRCGLTLAWIGWLAACGGDNPTSPPQGRDEVVMSCRASTRPRTDLPPSAQACVTAAGETHVHVTWRSPDYFPLRAVAAERWELPLNDAPAGQRLSLLLFLELRERLLPLRVETILPSPTFMTRRVISKSRSVLRRARVSSFTLASRAVILRLGLAGS
jgi:hypothetical protein